jgi:subtilase family serine protease
MSGLDRAPALAADGPDLIVQAISLSPTDPALEDTVTITVTLKNQGSAPAGISNTTCYVDANILPNASTGSIGAGVMATVTFTWKAEGGSHTFRAVADSSGLIPETDETNNTRTHTITTLAPDLIIQALSWTPTVLSRGDAVTVSVVIKNQGSAISRATSVSFFIDGNTRGVQNIASVNPGSSVTRTYTWFAQSGQHVFKAAVDEGGLVKEADETNNQYTTTFSTEQSDLIIEKVVWMPQNPSENDIVSFTVTVKNQGTGRSDSCALGYFIDGEMMSSVNVSPLAAGVAANVTFTWKALTAAHDIKTIIDFYTTLSESDETNNEYTASLLTLTPDMAVEEITWAPAQAAVGDTVTFTATHRNLGGGRAEASRSVIYIDGAFIGYLSIPQINAGAGANVTFTWTATGGSHAVNVVSDYDNVLVEAYEDNNNLSLTMAVAPPDLAITKITWAPEKPAIDDTVVFTITIINQGSGRAENFNIAYYLDNELLNAKTVSILGSGGSTSVTFTWKAINGRHTVKAIADYDKYVPEENEGNNDFTVTVAPNMPDLAIGTITWTPAGMPAGGEVVFDIPVENIGYLSAGPSRIVYYVDGIAAGYSDIGQMDPAKSVTEHFRWDAAAGFHSIEVIADSSGKIQEIDEENNKKTIKVPPPDIILQEITWSPPAALDGELLTFTATMKNLGKSPTQSALVTFLVNGKTAQTLVLAEIGAGETVTSKFEWTAESGSHNIAVIADVENLVTESDETNNKREIIFGTLTPDLYVEDISWLMDNPLIDDKATFTVTVTNNGTGMAGPFRLRYYLDEEPSVPVDISSVPAKDKKAVTFTSSLEAGEHTLKVALDTRKEIEEIIETNNIKTIKLSTLAPDLVVKTITVFPVECRVGDNVTITVKVENQGLGKALGARLALTLDGAPLDYMDIAELGTGAMVSRDFIWKAVPGRHEFNAVADLNKLILESNESNNSKSRVVTLTEPAAPLSRPVNLSSADVTDKGFMASWWWLILTVAGVLGFGSFAMVLKSFKKD